MKVKYEIFDEYRYKDTCMMIEDLYPNDPAPTVEEYTKKSTGEVVQFIKGGFWSCDKFLIADDETGEFIKVKVDDCIKIND